MRDTVPRTPLPGPHVPLAMNRSPQAASPAVINMDDSLNDTKDSQRKTTDTEESMLESSSAISDNLHDTVSTHESDVEPMDISNKTATTVDSDNQSECSSSPGGDTKYFCPICEIALTSQHEFTLHIRSHNNDIEIVTDNNKGFTCRICSKVLSSSSSLDRHVLVHSGERPFRCKICAVTFTTNGNMHRHMRTHSHKSGENYESDASTDSNASVNSTGKTRKQRLEFNNNNNNTKLVENTNKRKSDCFTNEDDDNCMNRRKTKTINNNNINEMTAQKYRCPVCDREDFASLNVLEMHLEDNHPDYEVRCSTCSVSFKNHRALNLHRHMVHNSEQINNINSKNIKNAHIGFKDLTFVDFSSKKFPHIARDICEKSVHKPVTGQKFICKCTLAFPCASALQMHQEECLRTKNNYDCPTDLSRKSATSDEEIKRDNFFAHLHLQNKSAPNSPNSVDNNDEEIKEERSEIKPVVDSKDLADIQSIISMTSNGSLLQHLRTKPPSELMHLPQENLRSSDQHNEEETQDGFAAEFRKMKLRGEFPCRLCAAVFPNLRALKGHNRAHLTGNGNTGPYRCNMCPHSSVDKAALIRHMRTHNGDRPYECSLCNYAFTTKANCERHLRNRHSKVTREEVKKSIIYHPSEDPTNDEVNKPTAARNEVKHSYLSNSNDDDMMHSADRVNSSTPKGRMTPELRNLRLPQTLGITIPPTLIGKEIYRDGPIPRDHSPILQVNKELATFKDRLIPKEDKPSYSFPKQPAFSYSPDLPETLKEEALHPKIHVKNLDGLKQIPDYDTQSEEEEEESSNNISSSFEDYQKPEHPMDLSMDVLDLSKKKESPKRKNDDEPQDFTKKTLESSNSAPLPHTAAQLFLAQTLLKSPANLYMNQLNQMYPGMFPNLPNLNLPPNPYSFLFPSPLFNNPEMKERMLRYTLSGGAIINDQFSPMTPNGLQAIHQQTFPVTKPEDEVKPPLHVNTQLSEIVSKLHSPKSQQKTPDMNHSPNSVKMVIKNGVLMPKQKQRRYRTERPFSCEHCSARFTLRSNMERHIKQQHPQFWSQRQRSGMTGAGRKPATTPPSTAQSNTKQTYFDLNIPNFEHIPKIQDSIVSETKDTNQRHIPISQQVKYAILAQQLKAQSGDHKHIATGKDKPAQDDDEDALVIDEENEENEKVAKGETKEGIELKNTVEIETKSKSLDEKMLELRQMREQQLKNSEKLQMNTAEKGLLKMVKPEEAGQDLVPVSKLLDNAVGQCQLSFSEYFNRGGDEVEGGSEEDEEGLVASGSTSEGNGSGSDENKSENETASHNETGKKKSAYSLAPNRNYMMRNVPERPYKCSSCPSSTFSTLSNLKKHMTCKHTPVSPTADLQRAEDVRPPSREYESLASSEDERISKQSDTNRAPADSKSDWENQISHSKIPIPNTDQANNIQNADLPFKCHLCEGSYAERQDALDHIRDAHIPEYELLMAKGALDQNTSGHEEVHTNQETEEDDHLRGKFPDYANRKVMCAFCMRRFWSAEDLRRHMRTHTGERPFSCDVCNRRFTLKHSMLRHRKKHNLTNSMEDNVLASGDEDMNPSQGPYEKLAKINNNNNLVSGGRSKMAEKSSEEDSEGNEGSDLIGNLLGIRDKSIIDQVLVSSADDAAKLLGVNNGQE
ncbi:pebbled [Carabus blaptoides fortunei]